jgi:hypothetical protein
MTAHAERDQIIFQKMKGLRRGMRIVAICATFLHRIVPELYLCNGTGYILMTVKTEFIPRLKESELII